MLGLLGGDGTAVHQLLHIGVVVGQLGELPLPAEVGAGVACVAEVGRPAPHEGADRRGAHPRKLLHPGGFLEDEAVGADERPLQEALLVAGQTLGILFKEAVLDDIAGAQRGLTASPCAAHAVAHKPPCRAAGQLPRPVVVLILLPDAADVCFSCKFHRLLLFRLCRSSRRGGAGRTRR